MPRGKKKTQLEKLNVELISVEKQISEHKSEVKRLVEKAKKLKYEINVERFREVSTILEEKNMSMAELKKLIDDEK